MWVQRLRCQHVVCRLVVLPQALPGQAAAEQGVGVAGLQLKHLHLQYRTSQSSEEVGSLPVGACKARHDYTLTWK